MLIKTDQFRNKLIDYKNIGITKVIIEEPDTHEASASNVPNKYKRGV